VKAAVVGASGYAGTELLRLCAGHPELEVVTATADRGAGQPVATRTPSLQAAYPGLVYEKTDVSRLEGLDVVFVALPHGASQRLVPALVGQLVVDLGADFRLSSPADYETWYGEPHTAPDLLADAVYGLPELFRAEIATARLVAVPGCYPTAALLALAPFGRAGLLGEQPAIVDAASGVSGAGRGASDRLHFPHVDGDFSAYGLLDHRHTPEIEQTLGSSVLFTPHLAPMSRGILATCYARPTRTLTTDDAMDVLRDAYEGERFVVVADDPPSTKATTGSNVARVTARADARTGWLVVLCALDNLVKGAAGQAVQCANLALGLPEEAGLPLAGMYP